MRLPHVSCFRRSKLRYLGWGLCLMLLVVSAFGEDKIFIRDSYYYSGSDSMLLAVLQLNDPYAFNVIDVGINCQEPLSALQFTIEPVKEGVHLFPVLHLTDCQDWYYQAMSTPDGGLKVIMLDSLLRGLSINPNGIDYAAWHIVCLVDSAAFNGIFPVRITEVQACDTMGKEIPLAVRDGQLIIMDTEALLFAPGDTFSSDVGSYTWKLSETNLYSVDSISFDLKTPSKGFQLKQVDISYPYWDKSWSQDSTGVISFKAWQTSPLTSSPCLPEKKIMDIKLTFDIDASLTPGVYQFEPIKMAVTNCSDSYGLSTAVALAPLVIKEPVEIKPEVPASALSWHLGPVYPNPFNSRTTIQYTVADPGVVEIAVFDLTGRRVQLLVKKYHQPGAYRCEWTGQDQRGSTVASGIYLVRMQFPNKILWHKMLLIK